MNKKQQKHPRLAEWALLAGAFIVGIRLAAPLMGDASASASIFDVSDVAKWTGQVVSGDTLDRVLPLLPLTDSDGVMSNDVATLQKQLMDAQDMIGSLQAQIRSLQQQLSVALSGDLAQAEPLRFAEDGTPYANPINPTAQGLLCTYFKVGC